MYRVTVTKVWLTVGRVSALTSALQPQRGLTQDTVKLFQMLQPPLKAFPSAARAPGSAASVRFAKTQQRTYGEVVVSLGDFHAACDKELTCSTGDELLANEEVITPEGWMFVKRIHGGQTGLVPITWMMRTGRRHAWLEAQPPALEVHASSISPRRRLANGSNSEYSLGHSRPAEARRMPSPTPLLGFEQTFVPHVYGYASAVVEQLHADGNSSDGLALHTGDAAAAGDASWSANEEC